MGGNHSWGTTFGCLTVKELNWICLHSWCAQICIVEHILDHTYIFHSILSTPTKLIQKEQGHLRYHFDSLKDIQECCLNCSPQDQGMKRQQELIETIPIFFLIIIVQVCTNRTKNVLNTNCPTLHVAPNMAKNTYNHGHT